VVPQVGILEIVIVLAIALIIFGPRRLPELGHSLGKGIREFREGVTNLGHDLEDEVDAEHEEDYEADSPAALGSGEHPEVTEILPDTESEEEQAREQQEGS
jgi:sec-independent protein translocase protein TatA